MQLRAGRVELTDLNINVSALAELLPDLSFRLACAHVGKLRVEISYSNLLTESLALFLDDVVIEIAPPIVESDDARLPGDDSDTSASQQEAIGLHAIDTTSKGRHRGGTGVGAGARTTATGGGGGIGGGHKETPLGEEAQAGEAGERLDFVAQWIEQITSKVKVIINNVTVRLTSAAPVEDASFGETAPFLEVRCSSLKWCDETPEASCFIPETQARQSVAAGIDRTEGASKTSGVAMFAHKVRRCTIMALTAQLRRCTCKRFRICFSYQRWYTVYTVVRVFFSLKCILFWMSRCPLSLPLRRPVYCSER